MVILFWDASTLVKRYVPELGSDAVDALFAAVPSSGRVSTAVSYAEIYSILLRKANRGAISRATFETAKSTLRMELIADPDFVLLSVDDDAFYRGIALMDAHNLNATDADLLILFKTYIHSLGSSSNTDFILVAADERLIRASQAEGVRTLNPETFPVADVPEFLA